MFLDSDVSVLKNVGKERLKKLNKLNIHTVSDLIRYYPRDYRDLSHITPIVEIVSGEVNVVRVNITSGGEVLNVRGLLITKIKAADETGEIEFSWFNQPYLKNYFIYGGEYIFYGKAEYNYGGYRMDSPGYELSGGCETLTGGRIAPVYALTGGLPQKTFLRLVKAALDKCAPEITDVLPEYIKQKYDLCDKRFAVLNIHFPDSGEAFFLARRRLVFDELLACQLSLYRIKGVTRKHAGRVFDVSHVNNFLHNLPFIMTNAQQTALGELTADLRSGFCMNRLLQGDVGSGKTAVAMAVCYLAVQNGCQAVIMAPTEILAKQHYQTFSQFFNKLGISTTLLTGSMKAAEKKAALNSIASGETQIVAGTHAVIQDGVVFKDLAFAVTDEQHRFGVRQRMKLSGKSAAPHVLVMTATPIPRTLALILYGDMDISTIGELPPGRRKIETYHVNSGYSDRIYAFIKKETDAGRQAIIVCPVIEENENADLTSVLKYAEDLKNKWFGGQLAVLHGKMRQAEKDLAMERFVSGEIRVIVSTTVIEVGVDVPNATVMCVVNADRFGLSQLHQLRGRVGRGEHQSYCILISDNRSEAAQNRLKAMAKTSDGFTISQLDLSLRGPGDFFGVRQHGLPEMKIANLYRDTDILKEAQEAAQRFIADDPELHMFKSMFQKDENDDEKLFLTL